MALVYEFTGNALRRIFKDHGQGVRGILYGQPIPGNLRPVVSSLVHEILKNKNLLGILLIAILFSIVFIICKDM